MLYFFRLTNGMDLKKEIVKYCSNNDIKAGYISACVGCCSEINLRLAGGKKFLNKTADYEIVSMTGTISENGVHIHCSFSDDLGNVVGGHLSDGCIVNTTAEVVISSIDNYRLTRIFDENTGYKELNIQKIH